MTQTLRTGPMWPRPLARRVLIEVEYAKYEGPIVLTTGDYANLKTAYVRGFGDDVPGDTRVLLSNGPGTPLGGVGARVVFSPHTARWIHDLEFEECGLPKPDPEAGYGDLGLVPYHDLVATITGDDDDMTLSPLGSRVIYRFDTDDASTEIVQSDGGIDLFEKTMAADNMLATVTHVGPDVENVCVGDRVVASRYETESFVVGGKKFDFVPVEAKILAVIATAEAEA